MNKRFLALAGLATVLSVGTYVVLNVVKPYKHETPKVADVTSPDQVFGASVDNPEAHADGEEAAAAAPAAEGATGDAAAVQPVDTAVQPAGSVDAAAATTSSGDGSVAPLVPAGAVAAAPAAAADASAPVDTAAAESQPAAESYSEPVAEAAPAPEPAPAPAPKPKKKAASKSASSGSSGSSAWWPAEKADKLSLVYAGPASYKKAVVLMFNGAFFQADTVNANIKVTDKAGKAVSGTWELGENNRRMLVFPVAGPGTYKVSIASGLTDNKGRKFGTKLGGPVKVN